MPARMSQWEAGLRCRRHAGRALGAQGLAARQVLGDAVTWVVPRSDKRSFESEAGARSSAAACRGNFAGYFGVSRAGSQ